MARVARNASILEDPSPVPRFWHAWLTVLTAGTALGGFLLAAFPSSAPVNALVNRHAEIVFWPDGSIPPADTTISLVHGVTSNAFLSTALLALFAAPLVGTAPAFLARTTEGSSHDDP